MDLAALIANATRSISQDEQPKVKEIVHTANEPAIASDKQPEVEVVEIIVSKEEFDRISKRINEPGVIIPAIAELFEEDLLEQEALAEDIPETVAVPVVSSTDSGAGPECVLAPTTIELIATMTDDLPSDTASVLARCNHCCSKIECRGWWTHGLKTDCRYPDLVNMGLCPKCLTYNENPALPAIATVPNFTPLDAADFFVDEKGKPQLSPRAQVYFRNEELIRVKDMGVEALTHHMQFYAQLIEELRTRSLAVRHKRSELEEEQLQDIPEEEREKFIQALRNGNTKKKRVAKDPSEPKVKKESPASKIKSLVAGMMAQGKSSVEANAIASFMIKQNKTQAQIEEWMND